MSFDEEIQAVIIHQLFRKQKWMANHIAYDKIKKWVVAGLRGKNGKETDHGLKQLIKENLIIPKPTNYGLQISLNIEFKEEIDRRMKKFYDV
ncbi:MAG: hypothetical protein HYT70_01295 [Candidatus Aenigmarchaeota archaeon]|nr:hypothetical protein [Candidatus Aenigmarchaeota archaeon]